MKIIFLVLLVGGVAHADLGKVDFYSPSQGFGEIRPLNGSRPLSVFFADLARDVDFLQANECVSYELSADKARALDVEHARCP